MRCVGVRHRAKLSVDEKLGDLVWWIDAACCVAMAVYVPDCDSGDLKGFGLGESSQCGKGCEKVASGLARHNGLLLVRSTHAGAGCHDGWETSSDRRPASVGLQHRPGCVGDGSSDLAGAQLFHVVVAE